MNNKNKFTEDDVIPEFLSDSPELMYEVYGDQVNPSDVAASALGREEEEQDPSSLIETPSTDDELHEWVEYYLNITIPRGNCCKEHVSPFDAFKEAYFQRASRFLWHGSRGFSGKSLTIATLALTVAITLGVPISVLGGSGEQATRVLNYMHGTETNVPDSFLAADNAPRYLLKSDPTKRKMIFKGGGVVDCLMASPKSVRGPHPTFLIVDELDEVDRDLYDTALGQPMENTLKGVRECTVASSTWQYYAGTMTQEMEICRRDGHPIMAWCYRDVLQENGGWLTREQVRRKKLTVPSHMWEKEYELQEPISEGQAFDREAIDEMFDSTLGEYQGELNEKIIVEEPQPGATYAAGADWAKSRDRTVAVILRTDEVPHRLVAYANMGRIPFPDMVDVFNKLVQKYEAYAVHDATGIGAVIHDYLEVMSEGVSLVGKIRNQIFSEYIAAVERNEIKVPKIETMYSEHKFCSVDDLYSQSGHPPDSVVAMALANEASESFDLMI